VMWLSESNWPVWSAVNSTPRRHQPLEQGDERGPLSQHLRVLEEQPADDLRVDGAGGRFDLVEAGRRRAVPRSSTCRRTVIVVTRVARC
jgi:hypothetical protein